MKSLFQFLFLVAGVLAREATMEPKTKGFRNVLAFLSRSKSDSIVSKAAATGFLDKVVVPRGGDSKCDDPLAHAVHTAAATGFLEAIPRGGADVDSVVPDKSLSIAAVTGFLQPPPFHRQD